MTPQAGHATVVTGPWGGSGAEHDEVIEAEIVDEGQSGAASGAFTRVSAAGKAAYARLRRVGESDTLARLREQAELIRDGRRYQKQDPDQEFLRQFHQHGDTTMPVIPERFAEYKWAREQIDKRDQAEAARRDELADWEKALEFGYNHAGRITVTSGSGVALTDMLGTGAIPNWLSAAGAVAASAVTLYQTRALRKAGKEYRHELVRKARLANQGDDILVGEDKQPVLPIVQASYEEEALDLTRRALLANSLPTRPVGAEPKPFGWKIVVDLLGGSKKTPADVVNAATKLEVDLGLPENGVLVQPHRESRARVTLWIVERDPFADLSAPPEYTPGQRGVLDPIYVGKRLDGARVSLPIPSTHGIVLAPTGGGKSILMRALVDGVGACRDAIQWDLDPSGRGQDAQAAVFRRRALTPADCEKTLKLAVKIAKARTALNLADDWPVSPENPALVLWCDEYPQLSPDAKDAAVELLRIGRKAGVWLVFAAQDPKGNALGEDVAGELGFQAGGPGLNDWRTRMLFGDLAVSEGWTPGRYKPKLNEHDVRDAGTFYLKGTVVSDGFVPDLAMPTHVALMSKNDATGRATRYAAAGLLNWDAATLNRLGMSTDQLDGATPAERAAEAAADSAQRKATESLNSDEAALLRTAADVYGQGDAEWVTTGQIRTEIGEGELAWSSAEARVRTGTALRKAEIESSETRIGRSKIRVTYYSVASLVTAANNLAD